jgi:hypothetical protein
MGTMLYSAERSVLMEMIEPHIIPYTLNRSDFVDIAALGCAAAE